MDLSQRQQRQRPKTEDRLLRRSRADVQQKRVKVISNLAILVATLFVYHKQCPVCMEQKSEDMYPPETTQLPAKDLRSNISLKTCFKSQSWLTPLHVHGTFKFLFSQFVVLSTTTTSKGCEVSRKRRQDTTTVFLVLNLDAASAIQLQTIEFIIVEHRLR